MSAGPRDAIAVGRFILRPEVRAILLTLLRGPLPGRAVARATGMPVAPCLRALRRLQRLGLVEASTVVDPRGRRGEVFHAHVEGLHLAVRDGRLRVRITLPGGVVGPVARP